MFSPAGDDLTLSSNIPSNWVITQGSLQSVSHRGGPQEAEEEQEGAGRQPLLSQEEEGQEGRDEGTVQGWQRCQSAVSARDGPPGSPALLQYVFSEEEQPSPDQPVLPRQIWEQVGI